MKNRLRIKNKSIALLTALLIFQFFTNTVGASNLNTRSIQMSTSQILANNVDYTVSFSTISNFTIGSVVIKFCDNSPIVYESCTFPQGFSASSATAPLVGQSGISDFFVSPASNVNTVVLSRPSAQSFGAGNVSVKLTNLTNPSTNGSFYARIYLYSSVNASGSYLDAGGLALSTSSDLSFSASVPPFLYFCVALTFSGYDCSSGSGFNKDFGTFSSGTTKSATSQFIVGTNAAHGFTISANGTTLTSGNNVINPISAVTNSQNGISQFGLDLRANSSPSIGQDPVGPGTATISLDYNTPNKYKYSDGDIVVSSANAVDYEKFTVSYIVNIGQNTLPGVYSTTITYLCLGSF